jgi:hypothetical protein
MRVLPSYDAISGVGPGAFNGLLAGHAEGVAKATYEHVWERDRALIQAVDAALHDAAEGHGAAECSRPRWLLPLIQKDLRRSSGSYWSGESFVRARLLERIGVVSLEADDTYVLAMISGIGEDISAKLRADAELVESAVWRLFEVEGGGEVSLANVDRFRGDVWRATFLELCADGTLDRGRVLRECLHALGRDFVAYRAQWFSATFLAFEPGAEEVAALQPELRRLLGASVPATVGFALKQLLQLLKAGRLDLAETLAALAPATQVKAKGTALEAVKIARAGVASRPDAVADVARAALAHPHADVQRAAVALLEATGDQASVIDAVEDLAPSVRVDLGLATALATAAAEAPVGQRVRPAPEPVAMEDLAERVAALLEDASDVGALEAVLDALVQPDSERGLAPLRKRALAVVARGPRTDMRDSWLPGQVARLVLGLLGEPAPEAPIILSAQKFVVRRLGELREHPGPLLALPDLPGGWVSADALVRRLASGPRPRHHDLVAALLRLHPEGREDAARTTRELPPAVRFALDGNGQSRHEGPEAWWVAARRSRAPYATDEVPRASGEPERYDWNDNGKDRHYWSVRFSMVAPTGSGGSWDGQDDQPTELPGELAAFSALADWIPTLAAVWPHDAEHGLALTCSSVLDAPGWELSHDVPRALDALAQAPGRLGDLAALTLAAGLSASHRHHRLHAVDAFVDLVPTGRLQVEGIAAALVRYAVVWPAGRWAESLASAARAPGGGPAVIDLLTALLPQLALDHRGLNKLLDVLDEQILRRSTRVTEPALLAWLGGFTGSSAAARTARRLREGQ